MLILGCLAACFEHRNWSQWIYPRSIFGRVYNHPSRHQGLILHWSLLGNHHLKLQLCMLICLYYLLELKKWSSFHLSKSKILICKFNCADMWSPLSPFEIAPRAIIDCKWYLQIPKKGKIYSVNEGNAKNWDGPTAKWVDLEFINFPNLSALMSELKFNM